MKPLYCFRYNPETGEILRSEITNYSKVTLCEFTGRYCVEYKDPVTKYVNRVRPENIDKLVYNKIYSFTSDIDYARLIVNDALKAKVAEAQAEVEKYIKQQDKLGEIYGK